MRAGFLRQVGLQLAVVAIGVQASLPFLVALLLAVYASPTGAAVLDAPTCLHDQPTQSQDHTPQGCGFASCPLCAALAASHAPALTHAGDAVAARRAVVLATLLPQDRASPLRLFTSVYRSRAPPSV